MRYNKQIHSAKFIAWVTSIVSILLATFNGLKEWLFGGPPSSYSPEVGILTVTLIAVIWYVYWTYLAVITPNLENEKKVNKERHSLASALLAELQYTDKVLRFIYSEGTWSYNPLEYPFLDLASEKIDLFSPKTIHLISRLSTMLRDLRGDFYVHIKTNKFPTDSRVKVKAQMACTISCELAVALHEEGAVDPPPRKEINFKDSHLPSLPPEIFPEAIQEWTYEPQSKAKDA